MKKDLSAIIDVNVEMYVFIHIFTLRRIKSFAEIITIVNYPYSVYRQKLYDIDYVIENMKKLTTNGSNSANRASNSAGLLHRPVTI